MALHERASSHGPLQNPGRLLVWPLFALCLLLGACAAPRYTVDDGRQVDEQLLGDIRAFGEGERLLRPAIARSAALGDADCDKQWELPFSVSTSIAWSDDDRVAWVRALGVDERLTVVAATPDSPLAVGSRIEAIDNVKRPDDPQQLLSLMVKQRDNGRSFTVRTTAGQVAKVEPFEVCRGYTRLAPPNTPRLQDYHWLLSMHPLELMRVPITDDEALWMVLWTQGLSEEGGFRMKVYDYGVNIASTVYMLATIASGVRVAALAAEAAVKTAQAAATKAATDLVKQQLIGAARDYATRRIRQELTEAADRLSRSQVVSALQKAAANRGMLSGVARVGATVFDRADTWALERITWLQGNALAGFTLHQKLVEADLTSNAFILDIERLTSLNQVAKARGLGEQVLAVLNGVTPESLQADLGAMPLASAVTVFSYEEVGDIAADPFANGVIDAMLRMPIETAGRR